MADFEKKMLFDKGGLNNTNGVQCQGLQPGMLLFKSEFPQENPEQHSSYLTPAVQKVIDAEFNKLKAQAKRGRNDEK